MRAAHALVCLFALASTAQAQSFGRIMLEVEERTPSGPQARVVSITAIGKVRVFDDRSDDHTVYGIASPFEMVDLRKLVREAELATVPSPPGAQPYASPEPRTFTLVLYDSAGDPLVGLRGDFDHYGDSDARLRPLIEHMRQIGERIAQPVGFEGSLQLSGGKVQLVTSDRTWTLENEVYTEVIDLLRAWAARGHQARLHGIDNPLDGTIYVSALIEPRHRRLLARVTDDGAALRRPGSPDARVEVDGPAAADLAPAAGRVVAVDAWLWGPTSAPTGAYVNAVETSVPQTDPAPVAAVSDGGASTGDTAGITDWFWWLPN